MCFGIKFPFQKCPNKEKAWKWFETRANRSVSLLSETLQWTRPYCAVRCLKIYDRMDVGSQKGCILAAGYVKNRHFTKKKTIHNLSVILYNVAVGYRLKIKIVRWWIYLKWVRKYSRVFESWPFRIRNKNGKMVRKMCISTAQIIKNANIYEVKLRLFMQKSFYVFLRKFKQFCVLPFCKETLRNVLRFSWYFAGILKITDAIFFKE